jgi:hypothetical protein
LQSGEKVTKLDYSLYLDVTANIEWVKSDEPVSWNYSTDSPNYEYYVTASTYGDLKFKKLEFERLSAFFLDNDEVTFKDFRQVLGEENVKSLLNTALYSKKLDKILDSKARELEPPSTDDF